MGYHTFFGGTPDDADVSLAASGGAGGGNGRTYDVAVEVSFLRFICRTRRQRYCFFLTYASFMRFSVDFLFLGSWLGSRLEVGLVVGGVLPSANAGSELQLADYQRGVFLKKGDLEHP